ncbi:flagellar motor protein [Shewanella sp.]|uniref:flagellar motor protein n=1 Tax=Shewanella sp. TaxID=50422 RepID=UPI003F3AA5DE
MSFIGVIIALIFILVGNLIEGGHPSALLDLPAFMIVIGGTIGATVAQFPFPVIVASMKRFKWLMFPLRTNLIERAEMLIDIAANVRKNGLLSIEERVDQIDDPFLHKGLQMLVDGYEKDKIIEVLEKEIEFEQHEIEQTIKVYEAMGGYSPTMGIVGAVFGLIHAMGLLDAPDKLGGAIAVAFVATIYGVAAANILFLPFANRYKAFAHQVSFFKELTLTGLIGISDGESPQRLQAHLSPYLKH